MKRKHEDEHICMPGSSKVKYFQWLLQGKAFSAKGNVPSNNHKCDEYLFRCRVIPRHVLNIFAGKIIMSLSLVV